jgi:hypothetical protein
MRSLTVISTLQVFNSNKPESPGEPRNSCVYVNALRWHQHGKKENAILLDLEDVDDVYSSGELKPYSIS